MTARQLTETAGRLKTVVCDWWAGASHSQRGYVIGFALGTFIVFVI